MHKTFPPEAMFDVDFSRSPNANVFCPFCEDEESSTTPSCSVSDRGLFSCKVCGQKGSGVTFYARVHGIDRREAIARLADMTDAEIGAGGSTLRRSYADPARGKLDEELPFDCHDMLLDNEKWLDYIKTRRGLTDQTIARFLIGCDEFRITIPVFVDGELVNVRRYLPNAPKQSPKMVTHPQGDGTPVLFPIDMIQGLPAGSQLIICEGEWDCLLLNQKGFAALTNTGNCKVWSQEWHDKLASYELIFIYDVNDEGPPADLGQLSARVRACEILNQGGRCKVVELPIKDRGGDITDYFIKHGYTADNLRELIDGTPYFDRSMADNDPPLDPATAVDDMDDFTEVDLFTASDGRYLNRPIAWRAVVAGRGSAPYLYPQKFDYRIVTKEEKVITGTERVSPWDPDILQLVGRSTSQQMTALRARLKVHKTSKMSVSNVEAGTLEELYLIPPLDHVSRESTPYCVRRCFFHGHGLETNRTYEFIGFTTATPDKQESAQVVVEAQPSFTEIDSFELTEDRVVELKAVFQTSSPHDKLEEIADELSREATKIYGRTDLHIAVDLVFHSPTAFMLDGTLVRKGWLEALILGDTRTGKGFVTEGLCRHYQLGEVVSAENMTFAGLIGGVQKMGDRWSLTWGKLPLNDRRLVVLDECSSLSIDEIGRLSRVRSEGIAEVTKIITEATNSRTRLIWLSNPRSTSRAIRDYNHGIEAVPELIGAPEDVARFDYVLIVSRDDVGTDLINAHKADEVSEPKYGSRLCQDLVLWCWSRSIDDIVFEQEAIDLIYTASKSLGRSFSSRVCLIQPEDVRFKIARIACAAAGRTFSTDDGQRLIVKASHVEFAYNMLTHMYNKPACGYRRMSDTERRNSIIKDEEAVYQYVVELNLEDPHDLIDGMQSHVIFGLQDICDFSGLDSWTAKSLLSFLVRQRCLDKAHHSQYRKRPAFRRLLSSWQQDEPLTQGEA